MFKIMSLRTDAGPESSAICCHCLDLGYLQDTLCSFFSWRRCWWLRSCGDKRVLVGIDQSHSYFLFQSGPNKWAKSCGQHRPRRWSHRRWTEISAVELSWWQHWDHHWTYPSFLMQSSMLEHKHWSGWVNLQMSEFGALRASQFTQMEER